MSEFFHDAELVRKYIVDTVHTISRFEGSVYNIQRSSSGDYQNLILCSSLYVSKSHCEIRRRDNTYWIKDLGSLNGTYLNGNWIKQNVERELRFGDIIGVGVSHLRKFVNPESDEFYVFTFEQASVDEEEVPVSDYSSGFDEKFTM